MAAERFGGPPWPQALGDLLAGLALLGGGIWRGAARAPPAPAAPMLIAGATWFAGDVDVRLLYAHRGPLVQLMLAYPAARPRPRAVAALVVVAYVDGLVPRIARSDVTTIVLFSTVIASAVWRHRTAAGVMRRACASALVACLLVSGTLVIVAVLQVTGADPGVTAVWAFDVAVGAHRRRPGCGVRWAVGPVRRSPAWSSSSAAATSHRRCARRSRACSAIPVSRSPTASKATTGGVDETGASVTLPIDGGGRVVTLVREARRRGRGARARSGGAGRRRSGGGGRGRRAPCRRERANAGRDRRARHRGQPLAPAARGRRRQERQELCIALGNGAERRLTEISRRVAALDGGGDGELTRTLRRLSAELDDARAEVHTLARGIYPRALTDHGLRTALAELAEHSVVPVTLDVIDRRFPETHEAAVYFVCSEGLANIAKYAGATRARITVASTQGDLVVCVADDGAGGARAAHGSGLRGLADRLEALGGELRVDSPPGAGTRLYGRLAVQR